MSSSDDSQPQVFISYSWTSTEHKQRVKDLADRLRGDGVDAIIDIYDLREGQDLNHFMEQMVTKPSVTKVLVICDKLYTEKANSRRGGVGTESQIISSEVYQKTDQQKFIALFFETEGGAPYLPAFLKGRLGIDMSTPERMSENYETLIRAIYNKPLHKKPALGKTPTYLLLDTTPPSQTQHLLHTLKDAALHSRPHANTLIKDYIKRYTESLAALIPNTPPNPSEAEDELAKTIHDFTPLRNEFIEFLNITIDYTDPAKAAERIFEFFESAAVHIFPPNNTGRPSPPEESLESVRFIIYELFVHTIVTLIKKQMYSAAHVLLSREYYVPTKYGEYEFRAFDHFRSRIKTLEDVRSRRLSRLSATADLLKERASPAVTFDEIMQAEYVLFLYSIINPSRNSFMWYPFSLAYAEYLKAFPLFRKAESVRHFENLKTLLSITSKDDFLAKYAQANDAHKLNGALRFGNGFVFVPIAKLGNFDNLATRP